MNLFIKLSLSASAVVLAGMILSGCRSTEDPIFTDNPNPPTLTESTTNSDQSILAAARLEIGETVIVATSTGSEAQGPIPAAGQPYVIADDGTISLPLVGRIQAAGKTLAELQDEIDRSYIPQYFIHLTTTVTAQTRVYYVGGEVNHPGPEVYVGQTTVTTAIQAAGDLSQFASHTKIWLTRHDGTRIQVNYDKALNDPAQDPPVFPGDKIEVHRRLW
ncbi:MAG TPA: polysaccharide biosynthesis/export family protein [Pseudomonadales bacterium]|nr:polysaccharide biosynthesis/export family protein [Pseudomonadales bacterium]